MGKWKRKYKRLLVMSKKAVCMPTHLTEELAEHVARQAYERGWSNSQYLRWLVILDKKRVDNDAKLICKVADIPREQFDLTERNERIEAQDIKKA